MKTPTIKKQGSANHAPQYDEGTRKKLLRFLAAYLTEAEMTLRQTINTAGEDRYAPIFANKIKYHENQVSTIKWLVSRVYYKQRHLLEIADEEIERTIESCMAQSQT